MDDTKNKLELQVNDLVLMNVVGMSQDGPIFGVIDRVGTMELLGEEAVKSPILERASEQLPMNITEAEKTGSEGVFSRPVDASVIAELEARRAALDAAIQELMRDIVSRDIPSVGSEAAISLQVPQPGDKNPIIAKTRRIPP